MVFSAPCRAWNSTERARSPNVTLQWVRCAVHAFRVKLRHFGFHDWLIAVFRCQLLEKLPLNFVGERPKPAGRQGGRRSRKRVKRRSYLTQILVIFAEKSWLFCRPARSTTATATPHRPSSPAMGKKYDFFCL